MGAQQGTWNRFEQSKTLKVLEGNKFKERKASKFNSGAVKPAVRTISDRKQVANHKRIMKYLNVDYFVTYEDGYYFIRIMRISEVDYVYCKNSGVPIQEHTYVDYLWLEVESDGTLNLGVNGIDTPMFVADNFEDLCTFMEARFTSRLTTGKLCRR